MPSKSRALWPWSPIVDVLVQVNSSPAVPLPKVALAEGPIVINGHQMGRGRRFAIRLAGSKRQRTSDGAGADVPNGTRVRDN